MANSNLQAARKRYSLILAAALACLFLTGFLFFSSYSPLYPAPNYKTPDKFKSDPLESCATPFGTVLGYAMDQPVFSNCNREFKAMESALVMRGSPHTFYRFYSVRARELMTGTKWQSIEFVQRFLFHRHNLNLYGADLDQPEAAWRCDKFRNPYSKTERFFEALHFSNYRTAMRGEDRQKNVPRLNDLIVYRDGDSLPGGHIAIVLGVEEDKGSVAGGEVELAALRREHREPYRVFLAEQNWDSKPWPAGQNYSRTISFSWKGNDAVLKDPSGESIIGFLRKGPMHETIDEGYDTQDL